MDVVQPDAPQQAGTSQAFGEEREWGWLRQEYVRLLEQKNALEMRVLKGEERRRAFIHILSDLNIVNRKLADQRKVMIHILADYEKDRRRLAGQTERLDNSRRALMHLLQDAHQSNRRLENSRKAMIHIMSDLKETTAEVQRREQELREKQEQLVQAGKLATLGELTTGVAHELNNPLNNIGLFLGNAINLIELGMADPQHILQELHSAMQQVRKATEIISHLRTFGRAASVSFEPVAVNQVIERAVSLMQEQLRLRQIEVDMHFPAEDVIVIGNAIQLEQVFLNLLTNARDAMANAARKVITITCTAKTDGGGRFVFVIQARAYQPETNNASSIHSSRPRRLVLERVLASLLPTASSRSTRAPSRSHITLMAGPCSSSSFR
jgi:C4-dicarboxylate-specific signal transduction histidine kinase